MEWNWNRKIELCQSYKGASVYLLRKSFFIISAFKKEHEYIQLAIKMQKKVISQFYNIYNDTFQWQK